MEEIESWYFIVRRDKARPDFFHPSFSIVIPIPANIVLELISLAKRQVSSAEFHRHRASIHGSPSIISEGEDFISALNRFPWQE